MELTDVTPLVLTFNEESNLARVVSPLNWAREVVVVDSGSSDATLAIARRYSNVRVVHRAFDSHAEQWNAGVAACGTSWVLALDADYVTSAALPVELESLEPLAGTAAYLCHFRYAVLGRPLRGSLYPPRAVLFNRERCRYVQDGHTQRLQIDGATEWLNEVFVHDDRKPFGRWLENQDRYARLEAEKLTRSKARLQLQDRIRARVVIAPVLVFLYLLMWRGMFLDGMPGWMYVCQRTIAEFILSFRLAEARFSRADLPYAERTAEVAGEMECNRR